MSRKYRSIHRRIPIRKIQVTPSVKRILEENGGVIKKHGHKDIIVKPNSQTAWTLSWRINQMDKNVEIALKIWKEAIDWNKLEVKKMNNHLEKSKLIKHIEIEDLDCDLNEGRYY